MVKSSFDEFVARENASAAESTEIDWGQQRDEWLAYLDKLYALVEEYLQLYFASGQIIAMKGRVDVRGPAGAATLVLVNSRAEGVRSLIHVTVQVVGRPPPAPPPPAPPVEITWEWRIFSGPPEGRFLPLTREGLFDLIMAVANG
jgi:hypothetical protein